MIKLTINGQKIAAEDGMSILDAALAHGIEIPALCHDPDLKPESSCRLCLVEVDGRPWPRVACGTPVRDGMVVETNTPEIREIRRDILQLLLDNHPNDCLTCQKAGECLLQKYAYEYGVTFRTHEGARRGGERARFTDTSSPYILRDESKCILCGKCISTCAELNERSVLSFAGRGFETKVAADRDETL
jgi:NADH dehydrogenase/NADH:ubiquinone oxidoreductase subunit G